MITIKVLGSGCENCKKVAAAAQEAVSGLQLEAELIKVTDQAGIHAYPILATPGLVINEKVVSAGRIPTKAEITGWLQQVGK